MATYTLFTASYGINYANLKVRILEVSTGVPAIVMASATSGILSSHGNAYTDSSGNLSVYLDSAKTFQVWNNQFLLIPNQVTLASEVQRTAAQLGTAPTLSDIGLGPGVTFYLDTDPTAQYRINSAKTAYVALGGGGGGSTTLSALTDIGTYDLGSNNLSVTAIKTTANAALPSAQKGAASGVATLDGTIHIPAAQIPAPTSSTLGGVQSGTGATHQFMTGVNTSGVPTFAQPAASDVSGLVNSATIDTTNAANITTGTLPAARLPVPSATTLGGIQSAAPVTNQFVTSISTSGIPTLAQPSAGNISGLATSATTDTTNAANITSGTLPAARLPTPTASTLGGVQSAAPVTNQFVTSISTSGVPTLAQPVAANVSGLVASATTDTTNAANITTGTLPAARLPAPTASTLGGVQSAAAVSHQFVTSISTAGIPTLAQPAASDISGLATSATTDTTNATNITSGTVAAARLPIGVTGGAAPNADTVQVTGAVVISVGNANAATYNGKVLEFTGAFSVTIGAGLPANFGFVAFPPASGSASIVSDGTTTLNGATATLTRAASNSTMFAVTQRNTNQNAYVVN